MVAFLGRYAHQPAPMMLQMPVSELHKLVKAVGQLLDEEHKGSKR